MAKWGRFWFPTKSGECPSMVGEVSGMEFGRLAMVKNSRADRHSNKGMDKNFN